MRILPIALLACVGCSLLLGAQNRTAASVHVAGTARLDGKAQSSKVVLNGPPNLCRSGLRARYLADGSTIRTARVHDGGIGQRLNLTLTRPDAGKIASATVVVEGWTPQGRLQQAVTREKPASGRAQRRLVVAMTAESATSASGDLWAPGLASVDAVELASIEYRDGSQWNPAPGESCRIAPDGTMLIAGQ